jgi:hypothetical protein
MRARAAGVLLALACAPAAEAGPWALGRGRAYVKIGYEHLRSTTLATPDGTEFDIPAFRRDVMSLYAAYGVSDRATLLVDLPLWRSSDLADDPDELSRESGLGDAQAGLQMQLGARGGWTFAVRAALQAPTGDETRAQGLLPTGSGVWEGQAALGAGRSLAGGRGWGFAEAGPQFRGGGLRDGLVYGAQIGYRLVPRLLLAANLRGVEPWSHQAPEQALGSFVGVGDRVTYLTYGPSLIVELTPDFSLQADLEAVSRARNLAKGPVFRFGFAYHPRSSLTKGNP